MTKAFQLRVGLTAIAVLAVLLTLSLAPRPNLIAQASPHNKALGAEQLNLLAEARTKKISELAGKEGWLRQFTHYTNSTNGGVLPNGKTIPNSYSVENWMFVATSGEVKISIDIMRDEQGAVIQTGVTQNGRTINKDAGLDLPARTINFAEAMAQDDLISFQKAYGGDISIRSTGNGQTVIALVISEGGAQKLTEYEKLVTGSKRTSTYDSDGMLVSQQVSIVFEDGSETVLNSMNVDPYEEVNQPPSDILKLIEE